MCHSGIAAEEEKEYDQEFAQRLRREAQQVNRRGDLERHRRVEAREQYKHDLKNLIQRRTFEREEVGRYKNQKQCCNVLH